MLSPIARGFLSGVLLLAVQTSAQDPPEWHRPFPPFRIAGNLYYVGTADLAAYLFHTPAGDILVNTDYEQDVPLIRKGVEDLGFRFGDIRIVLISHAHDDHVAGTSRVLRETGARLMVMEGDAPAMERGTTDFQPSDQRWTPVKVDRRLHDGDVVELGGTKLTAHLTAGHTKGCTTWTAAVRDGTRNLNVLIDCSLTAISAYQPLNDRVYPSMAADFMRTFQRLHNLPCDVFLAAHGNVFGLEGKYARRKAGGENPFVDPRGCRAYIAEREAAFRKTLDAFRGDR